LHIEMRWKPPTKKQEIIMKTEKYVRLMVGIYILISLALGIYISKYWFLFGAVVALILIQSVFTGWCPCEKVLKKLGVRDNPAHCSKC